MAGTVGDFDGVRRVRLTAGNGAAVLVWPLTATARMKIIPTIRKSLLRMNPPCELRRDFARQRRQSQARSGWRRILVMGWGVYRRNDLYPFRLLDGEGGTPSRLPAGRRRYGTAHPRRLTRPLSDCLR